MKMHIHINIQCVSTMYVHVAVSLGHGLYWKAMGVSSMVHKHSVTIIRTNHLISGSIDLWTDV